jgi:hypothetical protein
MNLKRIILFSIPIVVVVGGVVLFRRRMPSLQVISTDWENNKAVIRFGNNTKDLDLVTGEMNGGYTYSNRYTLKFTPSGKKMVFKIVDSDGKVVREMTIDYFSKLIY